MDSVLENDSVTKAGILLEISGCHLRYGRAGPFLENLIKEIMLPATLRFKETPPPLPTPTPLNQTGSPPWHHCLRGGVLAKAKQRSLQVCLDVVSLKLENLVELEQTHMLERDEMGLSFQ